MAPEGLSELHWSWVKLLHPRTEQFFVYHPNERDADFQIINVCDRLGQASATLQWKTCHSCRRGLIAKISIIDYWQRQGLGRRLILRAMRGVEDYHWTTTGQSPMAQRFFPVLSGETGAAFTANEAPCAHINAGGLTFPKPRVEWDV